MRYEGGYLFFAVVLNTVTPTTLCEFETLARKATFAGFCDIISLNLKYKYLYQDRENNNLEGEIAARDRDEAYKLLRKQGIRPYRVIGDDPWNWRPWAISAGYVILSAALVVVGIIAIVQARQLREIQMVETEEREIY